LYDQKSNMAIFRDYCGISTRNQSSCRSDGINSNSSSLANLTKQKERQSVSLFPINVFSLLQFSSFAYTEIFAKDFQKSDLCVAHCAPWSTAESDIRSCQIA